MVAPRHHLHTVFLPLLLSLSGCSKSEPAKPPAPPPAEVQVVRVQQQDVPVYGEWVGSMDGFVTAAVKAKVTGDILQKSYQEGSQVRQGQLLFEIDPRPLQAALAAARGRLAQAQGLRMQAVSQQAQAQAQVGQANSTMQQANATLSQANGQMLQAQASRAQAVANRGKTRLDINRLSPLAKEQAVTQQDMDNANQADLVTRAQVQAAEALIQSARGTMSAARAQISSAHSAMGSALAQVQTANAAVTQANAQIQTARAEVEAAELNLTWAHVVSPIDGIAGISTAQVGDLVSPTSAALTVVSQVDPIKVNFTVTEQEYMQSLGKTAGRDRQKYTLIQSDGSVYPRSGSFYAEDRNVSENTGAIRLSVTFPNPERRLRPGQYARIRSIRYVAKRALLIPQRAVSELQDRTQVAVVGKDNKVTTKNVTLGERQKNLWIVKEGLSPGDLVVVEGVQKATPGSTVKPKTVNLDAAPSGTR